MTKPANPRQQRTLAGAKPGAPTTQQPELAAGSCIRHLRCQEWGLGLVLSVRAGDKVDVYFEHHPTSQMVTLRMDPGLVRLSKSAPTAKLREYQERLTRTKTRTSIPRKLSPTPPVISHEESVHRFLKRFPRGFRDADFLARERNYKWEAHELFTKWLSRKRRMELLGEQQVDVLVDLAQHIEGKTNLLSPFEKASFRDGLRDQRAALRFFGALSALIDAPAVNEGLFRAYAAALEALPAPRGRVATWPVATIFPFLAQPDCHLFVKPVVTRAAAQRLGIDLGYDSKPNWRTYSGVLRLADELRKRLAPHGCRDMVDVQSFVWLVE